jgi:hypothetical protein
LIDAGAVQNSADEIHRISDRIVQLCEASLAQGKPYLLSQLGVDLGRDVQLLKALTGKKLAEFIRSDKTLNTRYRIAPVENRLGAYAIVKSAAEPIETEVSPVQIEPRPEPRYHYRFWAAFSVPSDGKHRFLSLDDFMFKNFSEGITPPTDWIAVEDEFIAPLGVANRDNVIKHNINAWLDRHEVDKARVLQKAKPVKLPDKSLLSAVIEALDRRQLQSTSLTLDVVATLLEKKF